MIPPADKGRGLPRFHGPKATEDEVYRCSSGRSRGKPLWLAAAGFARGEVTGVCGSKLVPLPDLDLVFPSRLRPPLLVLDLDTFGPPDQDGIEGVVGLAMNGETLGRYRIDLDMDGGALTSFPSYGCIRNHSSPFPGENPCLG